MPKKAKKVTDTTYEFELAGGDKVEVGDKNSAEFKPHIKLNRWDGEAFFTIIPAGEIEEETEVEFEDDKVKYKYKAKQGEFELEIEAEFYAGEPTEQFESGVFESEIILGSKPPTNQIIFDLTFENLVFYYQPPLTQDEIDEGAFRPDNIVGSYAVYHTSKGGLVDSQGKDYKTGKAFHLPRPKIVDDVGNWVWGELFIDTVAGKQIVTIPQAFLDSAVYPIRHAAGDTFGYTTLGGSSDTTDDFILGTPYTGAAGTAVSISVGLSGGDNDSRLKCAIYKDSDNSRVDTTGEKSGNEATKVFITENVITGASLTAIDYKLAWWQSSAGAEYSVWHDAGVTGFYDEETYNGFPATLNPTPWADKKYSIYCTYTPSLPVGVGGMIADMIDSGMI